MMPYHSVIDLNFLSGGGEMGELTRVKDWSKTSLGAPEIWPQSLRTTLSILIHSRFPMVLFWGPDLICFYNDAFRPSLGKDGKHPMILGMKGEEAWAEIWTTIKPWIDDVVNNGNAIWNEDLLVPIYRNGKIEDVYWTFSYSPVSDESGKPAGVFVAVVENTKQVMERQEIQEIVAERTKELKQLNESLKKSEERYHLMIREVQDYAIFYLSPEGVVENWNLGAEKIKGYSTNEIIGKHFSIFYTEEDKKNNLPNLLLQKARKTGRTVQEGWRVRKDGSLFWASVVITAVHNEEKKVIGFSKVTRDLTERKKADDRLKLNAAELAQKNAELQTMNKELQAFAYVSSHDLQEPLRKIQTFSSQIMEKELSNLSESGKNRFFRMQIAAQRMQVLIQDLLSYSRTTTTERKFEKINLNKIVEEVKEDLKEELHQKRATIETSEMCDVSIIPFQFRQLMFNLLSNSLKFSNNNYSPHIIIKTEIAKGAQFNDKKLASKMGYCHISISDNGIGFDQQYNEKIFEVFQRLHGRDKFEGTGIGLAIVKKIVENHNGIITAKSEPNKGTTFDIYIPAN